MEVKSIRDNFFDNTVRDKSSQMSTNKDIAHRVYNIFLLKISLSSWHILCCNSKERQSSKI